MIGLELVPYIFLLIIAILVVFKKSKREDGLPPGPFRFPIVGNLFQIGQSPHITFSKMSKIYGSIITAYFGSVRTIVLSDPELVRKCFNEMSFAGRPQFQVAIDRGHGKIRGLLLTEKRIWIEQRRFVLRNLRNFGFAKKSMELNTIDDLEELVQQLRSKIGQPIMLGQYFYKPTINSLWNIICGENLDIDTIQEMFDVIEKDIKNIGATGLAFFFPKIAKLAPRITGYSAITTSQDKMLKIISDQIQVSKKKRNTDEKKHLVDAYLEEIESTTDSESSFYGQEAEKQLVYVIADLFIAGIETTGTTLSWAYSIMAFHKDIQLKIQKEIDNVIGPNRTPELEDKPNLPYLECFIMEVLRYASVVPLGLFRRTTENVVLEGYQIPENTVIYPNIYGIHHDPKIWGDPEVIRPERFLMDDGITVNKNHESWMPFQTGKRQCPGEKLAMNNLFLVISTLCQEFEFNLDLENCPKIPHLNPQTGLILRPMEHYIILRKRN